jgi:hypothetical protein
LRTGFLLKTIGCVFSYQPLPIRIHPSYRCLLSRVLTQPCYDAHWLRQASDVHNHLRGPRHDHQTLACALVHYPLVSFDRFQGLAHIYTGGIPAPPWVHSLIALSLADATNEVPTSPLPAHRFSQPSDRKNVGTNLWVYSTPQALLGFDLQSLTPK